MRPLEITRRAVRPNDVLIDVLYAGICHSDIHTGRGDWAPPQMPCVPGHEIVGRVAAVGSAVTRFRVGDMASVGCMVDSCGTCEHCRADREQNCLNGATFTYDAPDKVSGGQTYGGYSEKIVVAERFATRIPPGADLAATAPLLCAGVTTFSPMQHWRLGAGQRVGVIGLGGLGHVAVKLADARRLGAKEAVLSTDAEAMKRQANRFDLLIPTVPVSYAMRPFLDALKRDGTLVNVGALGQLEGGLSGMAMGFGRKRLAGSMIGGIAETQEVIDYCAARGIKADVEVIRPEETDRAWERVRNKDVKYRSVIDVANRGRRWIMKATVLYGPGDVRVETRDDPTILKPTDAILRLSASCICGSDLWPYRGAQPVDRPTPMGHEYVGVVEEVGSAVTSVKKGQFVVGCFATSDNTCAHCRHGYQSSCADREFMLGAQAPLLRVPNADGTLVATRGVPDASMIPSLLAASERLEE